jgi:spermidine/putrescine transport system ATP-binding protein
VALARALVNRPNVLLLDEPLGALDLKLRKRLQVELKRIQGEIGITFVYVTHDQEEALTMSDRIAVMRDGRVEQLGTPEELYDRPTTRFVADFIGTTNLLTGAVESADAGGAVVRLEGGDACVVTAGGLDIGRTVELSIRPESILLKPTNGSRHGLVEPLRGTVEQVAYLGSNVQYQVRTRGGVPITAVAPRTQQRHPIGTDVDITWSPDEALLLAPASAQEEA